MFTGLIQHVGVVRSINASGGGATLVVDVASWRHRPAHGESIAVNGCCLTMTAPANDMGALHFDLIAQTISATNLGDLKPGARVNLEHAVTPASLMGGHIVQGHVDGVGRVEEVTDGKGERRVRVSATDDLLEAIIEKGSIAIEGVSLTIAGVGDGWFEVALIPTTLRDTTLGDIAAGARVNLECDYIAKTVVHWLKRQQRQAGPARSTCP